MKTKYFFERPADLEKYQILVDEMKDNLNIDNILSWSKKDTISKYDQRYEKEYISYRFHLLNKWIIQNQKYDKEFLENLLYIVDNLLLKKYFNAAEKNFVYHFQSCVFATSRNIKSLMVDFSKIDKNEKIYFHYEDYRLAVNDFKFSGLLDLYLSDHRIVLTTRNTYTYIKLDDIDELIQIDNTLIIQTKQFVYQIECTDIYLLLLSIKKTYNIINKNFVYENRSVQ